MLHLLLQYGLEGTGTAFDFLLAVGLLVSALLVVRLLGGAFDRLF
ncbi:hypothetical protein [Haloarcula nitratireducens]|nr:hypothetical protein [Halomicroarcula nitratireducens]